MDDCTNYFVQNTDISGLGVRIALYLQLFFTSELSIVDTTHSILIVLLSLGVVRVAVQVVAFDTSQDLITGLVSVELFTFGLLLASISTQIRGDMSFPNGSVVLSLLT